ncbi:MAG: HEAT repeat domain-containing protein [Isosphaeraceae bacterium]
MGAWIKTSLTLTACLCLGSEGTSALGQQVFERDTTITGPRGRSIERQVRAERGPGMVSRDVRIQRPSGTIEREVQVQRGAVYQGGQVRSQGRGFVPNGGYGPYGYRGFGPGIIQRDVIIRNQGPGWGTVAGVGGGLFGLGMLAGNLLASPAPPPPVVYAPPPVIYAQPPTVVVEQPPTVVYNPPVRYAPQAPRTVVVDPVANALARLRSNHDNSRRDGAKTLGSLGDARAVPALVDRLQNDSDKSVRQAAAWALGEIGDPRAASSLEYATRADWRQDVRTEAAHAIARLQRPVAAPPPQYSSAPEPAPLPEDSSMLDEGPPLTRPEETPPPPPQPDDGRRL